MNTAGDPASFADSDRRHPAHLAGCTLVVDKTDNGAARQQRDHRHHVFSVFFGVPASPQARKDETIHLTTL
jgi:hypothetical protein